MPHTPDWGIAPIDKAETDDLINKESHSSWFYFDTQPYHT